MSPTESDLDNKFEALLHRRVCEHFQNFKTYMNFLTYYIIAYRDRLILFDLTNEPRDFCVDQMLIKGQVLDMSLVKNPIDFSYNVMVTTKDN